MVEIAHYTTSRLCRYALDEVAESNQEAAEHLAEVEEALSTLQSVEVGSRGCQVIVEGITQSPGGSWIV